VLGNSCGGFLQCLGTGDSAASLEKPASVFHRLNPAWSYSRTKPVKQRVKGVVVTVGRSRAFDEWRCVVGRQVLKKAAKLLCVINTNYGVSWLTVLHTHHFISTDLQLSRC